MKIHTDTLTAGDLRKCVPSGCYLATFHTGMDGPATDVDTLGSRTHKRAFVVRLSGSNRNAMRFLPDKAATYDEWGFFLYEIFFLDPDAWCGNYKGVDDFEQQTDYKFISRTDESVPA